MYRRTERGFSTPESTRLHSRVRGLGIKMKKVPLVNYLMAMVLAVPLVCMSETWVRSELFPDAHFASEESYRGFISLAFNAVTVLAFFSSLAVVNLLSERFTRRKS